MPNGGRLHDRQQLLRLSRGAEGCDGTGVHARVHHRFLLGHADWAERSPLLGGPLRARSKLQFGERDVR